MSQDEALRMAAVVTDGFTGPLGKLRDTLRTIGREGGQHNDALAKGFKGVETAMHGVGRTASTVVSPALSTIGVTSLSVTAAVLGVGAAMRSFVSAGASLGQMSRETGVAANEIRILSSVAGKFGVESSSVEGAVKNFAKAMREMHAGSRETMNYLMTQGRTADGRKFFQDLARDIDSTSDQGEKMKKVIEAMEAIPDPVERGMFAQKFFGNEDFGRLGDKHLGKIQEIWKKTAQNLGPLDPKAVESAESFERSMKSLQTTMSKIGTTIASELVGPAEQFSTFLSEAVSEQRGGAIKAIREGIQGIGTELGKTDWQTAGKDAKAFLSETTALATTLAGALARIAETIHSLREGKIADAFRSADGGSGPLARKLAPRVGDDQIEAQESVDRLRKLLDVSKEAQQHVIGRAQIGAGLLDAPEKVQRDLEAAEARLKVLQSRTPEQRQKDFEASERLRRSVDSLTEEMKAARGSGNATVQQQSFDAAGAGFGGARIQTASLGGAAAAARVGNILGGRGGGIYAPGGEAGVSPPLDPNDPVVRRRFDAFRENRGGGRSFGAPATPAERVGERLRGEGGSGAGDPGMLDLIARAEGTTRRGYDDSFAHQVSGSLTGKTLGEIEQIQRGMRGSSAIGRYQFMRKTLFGGRRGDGGLVGELGLSRDEKFTPELQDRLANALVERRYREAQRMQRRQGGDVMSHFRTALAREWASFPGDYGQEGINGGMYRGQRASISRERLTASAQAWLDRREGRVASGASRRSEVLADPNDERRRPDFASTYRALKAEQDAVRDDMMPRVGEPSLLQKSLRANGVGVTPNVEGAVNIRIDRPGPDTRVRAGASGTLFRTIRQTRGRQMQPAGEDA